MLDFGSGNGAMLYPFLKTKINLYAADIKNNILYEVPKKKINFINIKKLKSNKKNLI